MAQLAPYRVGKRVGLSVGSGGLCKEHRINHDACLFPKTGSETVLGQTSRFLRIRGGSQPEHGAGQAPVSQGCVGWPDIGRSGECADEQA